MLEKSQIWLANAENTYCCGETLAMTLYKPVDIYLTGEVGAGKTTFLNGFSNALGITKHTQSPTYALENRYNIEKFDKYIHIDLYRLTTAEAIELLSQSEDHTGIRCIEWANRLPKIPNDGIHIHLEDKAAGRQLQVEFCDAPLPSDEQIRQWRTEVALPEHIQAHCDAVADFCKDICVELQKVGYCLRTEAVQKAAQLHDLLRFVDFTENGAHHPSQNMTVEPAIWQDIQAKYPDQRHEEACSNFLEEKGFYMLATIIRPHGLRLPPSATSTIEQKILYYSDKRIMGDTRVSLQQRFDDFMKRYSSGAWSEDGKIWFEQAKNVEQELFGTNIPL